MSWTDFFLYLSLFYVVYYAVNVVIDVLRKPQVSEVSAGNAYTFQTDLNEFDENPTVIEDNEPMLEPVKPKKESASEVWVHSEEDSEDIEFEINDPSPVKSTGGVTTLNSLFVLAKEGSIEMKKKVVFS
ncbi:hypothetical protein CLV31_101112 [Algoriphagus aquaeductus]|uniref:Uncharacterized protein n=1 Tax=Algoriphagus aquaeductus TaxID=475299 RepID=A0A326S010_9BACT|nr:hypothetical protein [Algoriphagus aquaeductus]PZV87240.1 hypothetical protein CLV31_101112 [Algoriphagus aquaeductus]